MDIYDELTELVEQQAFSNIPSPLPADTVPAMAYVPFQQQGRQYSFEQAIDKGTLFPVLNKPFLCGREAKK